MGVCQGTGLSGFCRCVLKEKEEMKKTVLAIAFSMAASATFAGSLSDPIIEEPVIVEATTSSANGILIPLLFVILVAAAAAS